MTREIDPDRHAALIGDLVAAEGDWTGIAQRHGLTPEAASAWARRAATRDTLRGLCLLADSQAQLLLSRCRLLAATRLLSLATGEEAGVTPEVSRKACVDLLKLDLRSPDAPPTLAEEEAAAAAAIDAELRRALDGVDAEGGGGLDGGNADGHGEAGDVDDPNPAEADPR